VKGYSVLKTYSSFKVETESRLGSYSPTRRSNNIDGNVVSLEQPTFSSRNSTMKNFKSIYAVTLFSIAGSIASAQYVSDGPFGPIAQVETQRSAIEKQMASPAERAMNKADVATTPKADAKVETKKSNNDSRKDAFNLVDTAR
jgi:hypothetical protein